jgi:hypothetical protein
LTKAGVAVLFPGSKGKFEVLGGCAELFEGGGAAIQRILRILLISDSRTYPPHCLAVTRAVFLGDEDVVILAGVEGRVEVDEIDRFVFAVKLEDFEVVAVIELVFFDGRGLG